MAASNRRHRPASPNHGTGSTKRKACVTRPKRPTLASIDTAQRELKALVLQPIAESAKAVIADLISRDDYCHIRERLVVVERELKTLRERWNHFPGDFGRDSPAAWRELVDSVHELRRRLDSTDTNMTGLSRSEIVRRLQQQRRHEHSADTAADHGIELPPTEDRIVPTASLDPRRETACAECDQPYWRRAITWLSGSTGNDGFVRRDAIRLSADMWPIFEELRVAAGGAGETLRDILVNATNALLRPVQIYPTVEAYEAVCKAHNNRIKRCEDLERELKNSAAANLELSQRYDADQSELRGLRDQLANSVQRELETRGNTRRELDAAAIFQADVREVLGIGPDVNPVQLIKQLREIELAIRREMGPKMGAEAGTSAMVILRSWLAHQNVLQALIDDYRLRPGNEVMKAEADRLADIVVNNQREIESLKRDLHFERSRRDGRPHNLPLPDVASGPQLIPNTNGAQTDAV